MRVSFKLLVGGGGGGCEMGGWAFKNLFEASFPCLWKKIAGTFFHRKGVGMPNFSRF